MRKTVPILLLAGALLAACASPSPDIDVPVTFDLGTVVKGERAEAYIPVRNLGDRPLTVQAVSTSCGCTTATLSSMAIPPAGEARLRVEYDSGAHETDLGRMERFIFISSDDPDEEDVQIKVTVSVKTNQSPPPE
jgi:hypothetical protein